MSVAGARTVGRHAKAHCRHDPDVDRDVGARRLYNLVSATWSSDLQHAHCLGIDPTAAEHVDDYDYDDACSYATVLGVRTAAPAQVPAVLDSATSWFPST